MSEGYLEVTQTAGAAFLQRNIEGPVVMLNLLKFREVADYSATPDIAPPQPISGRAAFQEYIKLTLPFLTAAGGEAVFVGKGGSFLIGPPDVQWDMAMLVRHASVAAFMSFAANEEYKIVLGHRTAALQDSRLLPLEAFSLSGNS